jgi:hypothetical protein
MAEALTFGRSRISAYNCEKSEKNRQEPSPMIPGKAAVGIFLSS